jgi:hypothetical protein
MAVLWDSTDGRAIGQDECATAAEISGSGYVGVDKGGPYQIIAKLQKVGSAEMSLSPKKQEGVSGVTVLDVAAVLHILS